MAFPATNFTLQQAWDLARGHAVRTKKVTEQIRTASAAGPIQRTEVLEHRRLLLEAVSAWNSVKSLAGLEQYAKDQVQDQTADIATEFNAMIAGANQLITWVEANFPTDGATEAALIRKVDGTVLTFTSAQLSTYRTHCSSYEALVS